MAGVLMASLVVAPGRVAAAPAQTGQAPDTGIIVYARIFPTGNSNSALCATDPDGSRTAVLSSFDGIVTTPALSPDATRVAFTREPEDPPGPEGPGEPEIGVMDVDGGNLIWLARGRDPGWSPDGTRIVYEKDYKDIRILDLAMGDDVVVGPGRQPDWSPDGTRILYGAPLDPPEYDAAWGELETMDVSGGDVRELRTGFNGAWSPDGTRIAFSEGYAQDRWLEMSAADGSGGTRLTEVEGWQSNSYPDHVSWSPDGTRISYTKGQSLYSPQELWTVSADGTGGRRILRAGGPSDWGVSPPAGSGTWRGRPCESPKLSTSLELYGHLFARGKVTTNAPAPCPVEGQPVQIWRRNSQGLTLAGRTRTDGSGSFDVELKVRRPERPARRDVAGEYQAWVGGADCVQGRSRFVRHRH
jgi:Tol biopolymer transport system component